MDLNLKDKNSNSPLAQLLNFQCLYCDKKLKCLAEKYFNCCGIIIIADSPATWKMVWDQAEVLGLDCSSLRCYNGNSAIRIDIKDNSVGHGSIAFYKNNLPYSKYLFIDFS